MQLGIMYDLLSAIVDASNILAKINVNVPPFSFRNQRFFLTELSPNKQRVIWTTDDNV